MKITFLFIFFGCIIKITFLFIFFGCIICFTCCNSITNNKPAFEFYYYPSKNVYYDVANKQYVYSLNGGTTWNYYKPQNNSQPATLGAKQIMHSNSAQPWDSNDAHRKLYNANLLAIANADSALQQPLVISEKKISKKSKSVSQPKKQTEEKKQGFFKRLFGKKHNK